MPDFPHEPPSPSPVDPPEEQFLKRPWVPAIPWLIGAMTLSADQLSKRWVASTFSPGESHPILPPVLYLTFVQNTGAAFGLLKGMQGFFIVLGLGVIGWIAWEWLTKKTFASRVLWGSSLILGGAVGNLIDRVRLGHVVDFIDVRVWPVFNLADSAITIGVGLLVLDALRGSKPR